ARCGMGIRGCVAADVFRIRGVGVRRAAGRYFFLPLGSKLSQNHGGNQREERQDPDESGQAACLTVRKYCKITARVRLAKVAGGTRTIRGQSCGIERFYAGWDS